MGNPAKNIKNTSHLKDLLLLFAIPIGIAIVAAAAVYVPRLLAHPSYDFIYSVCNDYRCKNSYSVDAAGHVAQDSSDLDSYADHRASLRYYDSSDNSFKNLALEEARKYQLDTSSKSPDGYTLTKNNSGSGFLFWGDYSEGWYLKDGAKKKKVEVTATDSYYSPTVTFLGWVIK